MIQGYHDHILSEIAHILVCPIIVINKQTYSEIKLTQHLLNRSSTKVIFQTGLAFDSRYKGVRGYVNTFQL